MLCLVNWPMKSTLAIFTKLWLLTICTQNCLKCLLLNPRSRGQVRHFHYFCWAAWPQELGWPHQNPGGGWSRSTARAQFNVRPVIYFLNVLLTYRKVASSSMSWLVAHLRIFRMLMKGKFDAYVLWPLAKKFQNWIVDRSTAREFTVCNEGFIFDLFVTKVI